MRSEGLWRSVPDEHLFRGDPLPIPAPVRDLMFRHCQAAYPDEACGALFGVTRIGSSPLVNRAVPMPNSARLPGEGYRIQPAELRRACVAAGQQAESLVGFYHSHPDRGASFSEADFACAMPGAWYVTLPVRNGRAGTRKAWFFRPTRRPGVRCLS